KLPPGVSTEYGLLNQKLVLSDTFVSSPEEVRKAIDEVTARFGRAPIGHTSVYDSLHEALKRFAEPQAGDSIVLLTDGLVTRSKLSEKELELEFRAAKARLLTIVVYAPYFDASDEVARPVQQLVARTGGSTLAIIPEGSSWIGNKEYVLSAGM